MRYPEKRPRRKRADIVRHLIDCIVWRSVRGYAHTAAERREAFLFSAGCHLLPDPRGVAGRTTAKGWG